MKELFFIFFVFLVCSSWGDDPRFDFPDKLEPKEYLLKLKTDFQKEKRFWGDVVIKVICKERTKEIVLNAKDLEIIEDSVKVELVSEKLERTNIKTLDPYQILEAEQYVIPVTTELVAEQQYEIHLSFSKDYSHDFNVYQLHSVIDAHSHSKEFYGFTRIGPGQARTLFPSMDQMKFKAEFEMVHEHPKGVIGFSNMPLKETGIS